MKHALLNYLACPACKREFTLRVDREEDKEIIGGSLICNGCGKEFKIQDGIPRLVVNFREDATAERFGYEWKNFSALTSAYEKQFLDWISPIDRTFFKDKIVLDAGCGKGRHISLSSLFGAKVVIGIDVSEAVDAAYANTKDLENVHVIQANIYYPPLKNVFEYIYSIGVLHHLPDPKKGFITLKGFLKPGGTISVWVYGREGNGWIIYCINPLRRFLTAKMPLPVLKILSILPAFLLYAACKLLYKPVNLYLRPLKKLLFYNDYIFYISDFDFKEIYSIVFDHLLAPIAFYLRKEEVAEWFKNSGIKNLEINWHNKNSWRAKGAYGE